MSARFAAVVALVAFLPAPSSFAGTGDAKVCSQEMLVSCSYPAEVESLNLISNKEELDALCEGIDKGLRCIDNYTRNCLHPHQRSQFNKLYSGTTMVLREICTDGSEYRKGFLKHIPCMKDVHKDYESCASKYQENLKSLKAGVNADDEASKADIKNLCCSLKEYLQCSKDSVLKTCGPSTASFASGFLDKMASPLVQDYCRTYTESDETCSSGVTRPVFSGVSWVFLGLLWLLLPDH